MISFEQIRDDLRDIRYYYAHRAVFDDNVTNVGANIVKQKVERYNSLIVIASPKLYDLYVGLYVTGYTHGAYALKFGYAMTYIHKINGELMKFFQKNLKEN